MATQKGKFVAPFRAQMLSSNDSSNIIVQTRKHIKQNRLNRKVEFTRHLSPQPSQLCGFNNSRMPNTKSDGISKTSYFNAIDLVKRHSHGVSSPPPPSFEMTQSGVSCADRNAVNVYEFISSPEGERKIKHCKKSRKQQQIHKEKNKENVLKTILKMEVEIQSLKERRNKLCQGPVSNRKIEE